ncbi:integrase/recombinase XerD [Clostridium pascui]|uniref:tyrosine-type recombinase/integrase n=1 Tax=Clostridium pascui TaxID=46609 RepID=UPI00195AC305|nr:tyrosine-type recombinase/integrase [Clostridium pascui]MBM7869225.1 integrase/recombinase XerD [Clostridium pascui]
MSNKKIPEFLTEQEQQQLINVFNVRYFNSLRNRTMIKLFLSTGLRLSEMIDLQWNHINLMTGQLKVVEGKGSKDRILWISDEMIEELRLWKEKQVEKLGKCEFVFTNRDKGQLKDRDVREMVANYADKAGITKKISPHVLRHTYATDLLRATKNIRLVQKALGHSDLSTTMIYTHIVDDEYEDALRNFRR